MNCNSVIGKINIIQAIVATHKPDIIAITETKIDKNFEDNELLGNTYTIWRQDRKSGAGGVLIALANDSHLTVVKCTTGPGESLSLLVQVHPLLKLTVINMYRPPNENELDNMEVLIDKYKHENCVMVGDYNLPDLDWTSDHDKCKVKPTSTRKMLHAKALEFIENADLLQLVHEPTHRLGNTLDLVIINRSLLDETYVDCMVMPYISDHKMIITDITPQSRTKATTNQQTGRKRYNYDKANFQKN